MLGKIKFKRPSLKSFGKGLLAVSTGGLSLVNKKNFKNIAKGALAVSTGGASLAFKKARPTSPFAKQAPKATPVQVVNTNLLRPTVQPNSVVSQSPTSPVRPLKVVRKAQAPAPIVGYNPNTKKVVRAKPNRSKGQGINININVNSQNAPRPQAMRNANGKPIITNNPLRKI